MRVNRDSLAAMLATAACVLVVALGFWKTRGPSAQRLVRADEKRVQQLSQLANEINQQYKSHDKQLPQKMNDSQKTKYADPSDGNPPEYTVKPPNSYSLCTTFSTSSPKEETNGNFTFWIHAAGSKCFEFDAAEQVPQAPYFFY